MSLVQDIAILRQIPMLSDFSDDQLRLLAFSAEAMDLISGSFLFDEGERADSGIVIAKGNVSLQVRGPHGFKEVDSAGPGVLLGETAMLVETRRPARAVCIGPVRVIRIRRALFKRMIQEFPELARRLLEVHASRFQATVAALTPIGDKLQELSDIADAAALRGSKDD